MRDGVRELLTPSRQPRAPSPRVGCHPKATEWDAQRREAKCGGILRQDLPNEMPIPNGMGELVVPQVAGAGLEPATPAL
jgi:hypothetical protein